MALYEVERTDQTQPGEFISALVVASGTAQARNAVRHLPGVTAKNVAAKPAPTKHPVPVLLATIFDEREPEPAARVVDADGDYYTL